MPTVITVPIAQRSKSVKFGAAYSPALTFNPDKKLFFHCSGVLFGMDLTVNTVPTPDEVTVDPGAFIQRGIIVEVTSAQVVQFPDPLPGVPIYLVAENANEVITSSVTIGFTTAPAAESVIIGSWPAPITTTTFETPQKISICEIVETLNSISQLVIKRHHVVASSGQTVFTVPTPFNDYVLGANKIWVFRNGQKLEIGLDYNETTVSSITLTFGATTDDEVELITLRSAPPITSLALLDLTDVTTDLANAIKDTSVLRVSPATAANPLATIADITAAIAASAGLFTFAKYSTPVGSVGFSAGTLIPIVGTSVPFTLTASRPVKFTVQNGGFWKSPAGVDAYVFLYIDGAIAIQMGYIAGSDSGSTVVETTGASGHWIDTLTAGAHTAAIAVTSSGSGVTVFGPIFTLVETGEPI